MAAGARIGIKILGIAIGIPVSIATRKLVSRLWITARPDNPPHQTTDGEVLWRDAVGWAAMSAAGVVTSQLVTRAGANATYRAITGNQPPPPKPSKAEKKAQKKAAKENATA